MWYHQLNYERKVLENFQKQKAEIRESVVPEILKTWREKWYAQEKEADAKTETFIKVISPSMSSTTKVSIEIMLNQE